MKNLIFLVVFVGFVVLCFASLTPAQIKGGEFNTVVDSPDRQELEKGLVSYIQKHRDRRWGDLYGSLYEKRDKETFVKEQLENPNNAGFFLLDFTNLSAVVPDPPKSDWIIIHGCAKVHELSGKKAKYQGFVNAYRTDKTWMFSVIELARKVGLGPIKC